MPLPDVRNGPAIRGSRVILIIVLASFLVTGVVDSFLFASYRQTGTARIVHVFVVAGLLFAWCKLDARERSIVEPRWAALLVGLVAVVGIPLYFFRTQPPKRALLSIFASMGFLVLALAAFAIGLALGGYVAA